MMYELGRRQPFRKIALLGRGGYGEVWRSILPSGQHVAVKFLTNDTPQNRENFIREVEILEQLAGVPYVVQIYGKDLNAVVPYFYMELCSGPISKWTQKLSKENMFDLLSDLVHAYEEISRHGIRHRDLKPQNILTRNVNGIFKPVLVDFGIARSNQTSRPCNGTGTPAYTAPEVLAGEKFTTAADIYSLGIVMYELVTGKPERPFLALNIPGSLNLLLSKMTDPNPSLRPSLFDIKRHIAEAFRLRPFPVQNALAKATGGEVVLGVAAVLWAISGFAQSGKTR